MSIFNYFTRETVPSQQNLVLPSPEEMGVSSVELRNVSEMLNLELESSRKKRVNYKEEDKIKIAKYANYHTTVRALKHFKKDFPSLSEPCIRRWLNTYRRELKKNDTDPGTIMISRKRGKPLYLPEELDEKLRSFLLNLQKAGGNVNRHVVSGVLMGLIKSNLNKYGSLVEFSVTRGWLQYLYKRMNMSRRMVTTSRPTITKSIWEEAKVKFLHDIVETCIMHQIPDELIINIDQTPSKYVATDKVTMAVKGSKHVSRKGADDKRQITATFAQTLSGEILPFQLIYKGKTKRSIPSAKFPEGFLLSANQSHWSNEDETVKLLDEIIKPHLDKTKEKLGLDQSQKACIIWDSFRGQETEKVKSKLNELHVDDVGVPKNMTHLLQPLDLTTNSSAKKIEKQEFSAYFTRCIQSALEEDPNMDVTAIEIDMKLSTLKPLHAATLGKVYDFLSSENGKRIILSGWKAAGITEALRKARETNTVFSLNPYE